MWILLMYEVCSFQSEFSIWELPVKQGEKKQLLQKSDFELPSYRGYQLSGLDKTVYFPKERSI